MNRPMNTCKFSFMKYIRVMMLALLPLWCDGVVGQTFEGVLLPNGKIYENYVTDIEGLSTCTLNIDKESVETDLKSINGTENGIEKFYIRWYIQDSNGNYYPNIADYSWNLSSTKKWCLSFTNASQIYSQEAGYYYYSGSQNWTNGDITSYLTTVVSLYVAYGAETIFDSFLGYSIVCVITDDLGDGISGSTITSEPDYKIKYVFHIGEPPFYNVPSLTPIEITPSYTYSALTAQPKINVDLSAQQSEGVNYVRWYLTKDGSEVSTDEWRLSKDGVTYQTYQNSRYFYTTTARTDLLELTVTPPAGVKLADYQLVCLVSDNDDTKAVATDGTLDTDGEALTTEPTIDAQYVVSFEEIPFENVASVTPHTHTVDYSDYTPQPLSVDLTTINNSQGAPLYARVGLQSVSDDSFVSMDGWTITSGGSLVQDGTYGNTFYYNESEATADLLTWKIQAPDGISIDDYRLVVWVATTTAGNGIEDGVLITEPAIENKYTISFNKVAFENTASISEIKKPQAVNIYEALTDGTSLPLMLEMDDAPCYVRWYWASDDDGNTMIDASGWSLQTQGGGSFTTYNAISYYSFSNTALDDLKSLTVTPPSGSTLKHLVDNNWKLVALVSTSTNGSETEMVNEITHLIKEPTIQTKYVISFEYNDPRFDGTLATDKDGVETVVKEVPVPITEGQTSVTLEELRNDWYNCTKNTGLRALFDFFGTHDNQGNTPKYRRVYVRNKQTQEMLTNQNDWIGFYNFNGNTSESMVFTTDEGEFWTRTDSYAQSRSSDYEWFNDSRWESVLRTIITVPSGSGLTLEDIEVVFILSNEDARVEDTSTRTITQGPATHQVEYYFTFDDGVTTFPGSAKADAIDETFTEQLTADEVTSSYAISLSSKLDDAATTKLANTVYFRWEVTDADGNVVTDEVVNVAMNGSIADDNLHTFTQYGKVWYAGYTDPAAAFNTEYLNVTLTPATGKKLTDYTYTCYMATDLTNAVQDGEGEFIEEPDYDARYVLKLEQYPFENVPEGITGYPGSKSINWLTTQPMAISLADYCTADGGQAAITYVRYLLTDKSGNEVPWNNAGVTLTAPDGHTFTAQGNSQYIYQPVATSDLLTVNLQATTLANLQNYNLKAYVSTQVADITTTQREPEIEAVYTVSFDVVTFENTVSATEYKTINIYDELTYEDISVDLGGEAPTYVRWSWDGNNVASTDWTFANADVAFTDYNGTKYCYAGTTANEELNQLTITPPAGTDAKTLPLTGLKLIALVSTKTENDGAQTENGELIKEPFIDTKYIISFETVGFEGSVANAHSLSETVRLEDASMSSVTLSLPLSSVQGYMNKEESSFYIRYYLTDKTGNRIALPDGVTITPKDITLTSNDYGHYWYSSTGIGAVTDLEVTVADANGTTDLRNYNVVAVMSSNAPLQVEADGTVTYEPREMEVVYTFELKKPVDNSFDGACTGDTIYVTKKIEEGETTVTLTDVRDDWDKLEDLFEPNSKYVTNVQVDGKKVPRYRRVYVRHKKTKESLNWIVHTDGEHFNVSDYGHIWTAKYDLLKYLYSDYYCWFDPTTSKFLTTTIKVPDGSSLSLLDVEVVFILAQGDAREEDTEDTWTITKGPEEHEVEYIFRFTDGIDRFSGSEATDAIKKSFRRELEEDESGVYDKTEQLNLSEDMSDDMSAEYKAKLSGAETVYLRWYVTDKSGNILSPDASPVSLALSENDKLHQTEYGYIWYSGYDGEGTFSTDLLNVTATASANVNLYDYNVVCVMTTDVSDAIMEGGEFVKESSWEARYTYTFTRAFAGELADDAKTIYKTLVVADDATSVKVPLSKRIDEIRSYFGMKSYDELNNNFHIRWALLDNGGNEVYTQGQLTNSDYHENDYGIYWNTKANKNSKTFPEYGLPDWFDATYTLLDGAAWSDYKLVIYMTDDNEETDGVRTETYIENSSEKTRLIHEPNHLELRYIIDFQTVSEVRNRFVHYKGYTNSDFTSVAGSPTTDNVAFNAQTGEYETVAKDIRQQTHEWTYEIYIKPGATKNLVLPILSGNNMEPQAYFRWYDWNTDQGSTTVSGNSGTLLSSIYTENRGLFGICLGGASMTTSNSTGTIPTHENVGVVFKAPETEWSEPIVIACDISKYGDGMDLSETYLVHEPTLSYRYKYIIRPAKVIAEAIKKGVEDPNDNLLENHGDVTVGINVAMNSNDDNAPKASLRLNLSDVGNYYFYPYTLTYDDDGNRVETWGKDLLAASKIFWRVYDSSGEYYLEMGDEKYMKNGLFYGLRHVDVNGAIFVNRKDPTNQSLMKKININIGDPFYVFAYASDATKANSCPIARFNCRFSENYPIAVDDVVANTEYRTRTVNYLDQHYSRVGLISFDVEEGGTLALPTFPLDNMNPMPFKWSRSHYGYCYPELYSYLVGNAYTYYGLSPIHGDYTLIKSMNLDDVSEKGSGDGYLKYWWRTDKTLRDLTHRYSAGSQNGYFLYVDASEESRPIANVAFEGEMCVGSTLVLSAMVADMTYGNENPQLIFKLYGIKTDVDGNETERKLVHSFATCDFETVGASDYGVWYQVYAKVTLQNNSGADQYRQFIVSIDNYCASTDGADYAIDDIRIYAQNSKVEVKQGSVLCSGTGQGTKADIMIPHETLLAMMPSADATNYPMPVYYRICTEDGEVVKGIYGDEAAEEYGQVDFRYYFYDAASSDENEKAIGEGETTEWLSHHYRKDAEGKRYFVVNEADQKFALKEGEKYYVSLAVPKYNAEDEIYELDDYTWGSPQDPCSMYSDVFQPLSQSLNLMVGTNGINRINVDCHLTKTSDDFSITGALQLPDSETGELVSIDNPALCSFDWIVENVDDATIFTNALRSALVSFRSEYRELLDADDNLQYTAEGNIIYHTALPETRPADDAEGFNGKEYDLLKAAIDAGKLYIVGSSTLKGPVYKVGNTYRIIAVPLEEEIVYHGTRYEVCPEPMEVTVEARLNGPELDLGFKEVDYEGVGLTYGADGLRVGLKQLEKMQQEEIPLHLPISKYKQLQVVDGKEEYVEYDTYDLILDEFDVIVWDSNDPTWAPYLCKEKDLYGSEVEIYCLGGEKSHEISNKNQSVELLLHSKFTKKKLVSGQETVGDEVYEGHKVEHTETSDKIKYHEGYWYKVKFRYSTRDDAEGNQILGRCYGESYITIKVVPEYATWGEGLPNNSNWLNDGNWRRSSKAELYKEVVNSNDYPVYDESTGLSNDKGFVPMSFTYVTILGGMPTPYPYLSQLQTNKFTGLITEETLTNGDLSPATTLIQYDLMVTDKPGVCLYDASKTNVYECERFYGNVCKDIYFKPRAQLRNQHYLTYTKAWVDVELLPGQWTMLAAPLMKVHAGNFYVPTVEGTLYGRQETEAFQPIEFDAALNSRNAYPFYQRSWDKKESKVVTTPDDIRGESDTEGEHWYDAFVSYNPWTKNDVKVECLQWSHAYNDMQEHYEPGKGFSIKAHHKDDAPTPLIRLPKADDAYTYYNYKDEANPEYEVKIDTIGQHRLAVDGVVTGMLAVPLTSNETEANGYYLVGNPYMARLDMELFFSYNPQLVKTYWVVTGNEVDYRPKEGSTSLGIIGPMQSFFVKVAEGKSVSQVIFSPDMQASNMKQDVVTVTDETMTTRLTFATRAAHAPMASSTQVVLDAGADDSFVEEEDVETLLDSNLSDVPVVYTVAGTQAAMVNRLSDLTLLPLGVFGKEGTTETVTVNGADGFEQPVYLFDAVTRAQMLLEEGTELTLAVGEHGRYFLTTKKIEEDGGEKNGAAVIYSYSMKKGELIVATMPDNHLAEVQVYDANGNIWLSDHAIDNSVVRYALPTGIYVVKATSTCAAKTSTMKVIVR